MPSSMLSGLFCVMFGIIVAVGLAQMSYTQQDTPRNVFILGFCECLGQLVGARIGLLSGSQMSVEQLLEQAESMHAALSAASMHVCMATLTTQPSSEHRYCFTSNVVWYVATLCSNRYPNLSGGIWRMSGGGELFFSPQD